MNIVHLGAVHGGRLRVRACDLVVGDVAAALEEVVKELAVEEVEARVRGRFAVRAD